MRNTHSVRNDRHGISPTGAVKGGQCPARIRESPTILACFARLGGRGETIGFPGQRSTVRVARARSRHHSLGSGFSNESMSLHRRVVALVSGLLLFQFTLGRSGLACTTCENGGSFAAPAMNDIAAMGMTPADQTLTETSEAVDTPDATPAQPAGTPADGECCDRSSTSEACTAMASCAPSVLGVDRIVIAQAAPLREDVASGRIIPPPSLTRAPDHPPPRA